jgi:hypothetical protein
MTHLSILIRKIIEEKKRTLRAKKKQIDHSASPVVTAAAGDTSSYMPSSTPIDAFQTVVGESKKV